MAEAYGGAKGTAWCCSQADAARLPGVYAGGRYATGGGGVSGVEQPVDGGRGEELYEMPVGMQSDGTRRVLGLEAAIYRAMKEEKFLSIDEMDSSLHPDLLELVVRDYLDNGGRGQLIFTTHYDPLLNTVDDGLLRKDSVVFTEKDESGSTRVYPLIEFRRLNKISSFQRSYRNGMFGAVPNIKKQNLD